MKSYICECGREFNSANALNGHRGYCKIHLGEKRYNRSISQKKLGYLHTHITLSKKWDNIRAERLKNWINEQHRCEFCNEIMTNKYGSGRFCSSKCARSFSTSHLDTFNNGAQSYRNRALRFYDNKCAICKWDEDIRILQVHHKDSNRDNNELDNLIILCPNCHWKITLGLYELYYNENKWLLREI